MESRLKELALSDLGTTLVLLVEDLKSLRDGLVTRSQIVDDQILASRQLQEDMDNAIRQLRDELTQFRGDRQICGKLNIVNSQQQGTTNARD